MQAKRGRESASAPQMRENPPFRTFKSRERPFCFTLAFLSLEAQEDGNIGTEGGRMMKTQGEGLFCEGLDPTKLGW